MADIEKTSLESLELEKLKSEITRNLAEARQFELNIKPSSKKFTTIYATIIVALLGLAGTLFGIYLQGKNSILLKRQEFESNLIIKAVQTGDIEQSKINLEFLLETGFVSDVEGKIANLVASSDYRVKLPALMTMPLSKPLKENHLATMVSSIIELAGIAENFKLLASYNTPSIMAVMKEGERLILYNPVYVESLRQETKSNWSTFGLVAHEVAHHALGHMFNHSSITNKRKFEIEADAWMGKVLRRMGLRWSKRNQHLIIYRLMLQLAIRLKNKG